MPSHPTIPRVCEHCGTPFLGRVAEINRRPLAERFWEKVNKNGPVPAHRPELGPCWVWTGGRHKAGYGAIGLGRSAKTPGYAHRVSWELHFGPIPDGLFVLHLCDYPPCVRAPGHLILGTGADNTADMIAKGRMPVGEDRNNKLTEAAVLSIRADASAGVPRKDLAEEHNVCVQNIDSIVNGQTWKHLLPQGT